MTLYEKTPPPIVFASYDEWLAARSTFVGASESAGLLGLSPWSDPWKIYGQKTGLIPPMADTQKLRLGRRMEKILVEEYSFLTGRKVRRLENTIYRDAAMPFFAASPDCLCLEETRGVEFKNVGTFAMDGWGPEGTEEIPAYYLIQVQHTMEVLDVDAWDVCAMMAGQEVRVYEIRRVRSLGASIREAVDKFWTNHILPGVPPAIDGSETAGLWIGQRWPKNLTPLRVAEPHEAKWLEELRDVKLGLESLEAREAELENLICMSIGESDGYASDIGTVTWKERAGRATTDWRALCADRDIPTTVIDSFTSPGKPIRAFIPKFKGAK